MKKTIVTGTLFSLCVLAGCYYDVEQELYGSCNTADPKFSTTILPVLSSNDCLSCHSGPTPSGNINLTTYAGVKARVTDGKLLPAVKGTGPIKMPPGGGSMSPCDIRKIEAWVNAGAPEN
jgi:hypothetical protein